MAMTSKFVLDEAALAQLNDFLNSPKRPEGTFSIYELQGFLFAVASCPANIPEDEWMEVVFDDQDPACNGYEESEFIYEALTALHDNLRDSVENESVTLPESCRPKSDVLANFDENAPLSHWCNGFLTGHGALEEAWDELPEDIDEEVGSCVMMLSFFADQELARSYYSEFCEEGETFEEMAQAMAEEFEEAMTSYADLGNVLRNEFAELD